MAITTIGDILGPRGENVPILNSYMTRDPIESTAFMQSGVLTTTPFMQEVINSVSPIAAVPFWNPISADVEPNYSNDVYEDIAVPRTINTGLMQARMAYLNEGFGQADLTVTVTKQNPLQHIAGLLDNFWQRQAQRRLLATVIGIYNDNIGATDAHHIQNDMVTNANGIFSPEALIDAQAQFGDGSGSVGLDGLGALAVPRAIYTQMQKQNLIDFVEDSEARVRFAYYQGVRLVVDDGMPVVGETGAKKAVCVLMGAGAIGYAAGTPHTPQEYERAASRANGGGVDTLWSRRDWLMHPLGYSFLSAKITGNKTETRAQSASWQDLADATNWQREFDRKDIPLAFLVVNLQ
ncbi:MAG: coat protein [Caudoviricetes sp.]|nr:MAG: coat protein [Caudoviricetes sp.]